MVKPPAPSVWDATGVSFLIALMGGSLPFLGTSVALALDYGTK